MRGFLINLLFPSTLILSISLCAKSQILTSELLANGNAEGRTEIFTYSLPNKANKKRDRQQNLRTRTVGAPTKNIPWLRQEGFTMPIIIQQKNNIKNQN